MYKYSLLFASTISTRVAGGISFWDITTCCRIFQSFMLWLSLKTSLIVGAAAAAAAVSCWFCNSWIIVTMAHTSPTILDLVDVALNLHPTPLAKSSIIDLKNLHRVSEKARALALRYAETCKVNFGEMANPPDPCFMARLLENSRILKLQVNLLVMSGEAQDVKTNYALQSASGFTLENPGSSVQWCNVCQVATSKYTHYVCQPLLTNKLQQDFNCFLTKTMHCTQHCQQVGFILQQNLHEVAQKENLFRVSAHGIFAVMAQQMFGYKIQSSVPACWQQCFYMLCCTFKYIRGSWYLRPANR